MAGNLSLGVKIGGAVDASLGRSLSSAGKGLDALKAKAERTRGLQSLIGETVELGRKMRQTVQEGGAGLKKLEDRHSRNLALLKQHGVAVGSLEKEYQRLGKAARSAELVATGKTRIGEGIEQTKSGLQTGAAVAAGVAAPTMIAANYQAIIRDIAIKGGIARTGDEQALSDSIRRDAAANGMGRDELAQAVNALVAGGMAVKEAGDLAGTLARFSVGQNAATGDVASMVLALRQAGIADPKAIEAALGKVAVAGDLGSFEAKDMAKWFASLMPQMTGFGMSGENATVALAGMLQTQMKAAGSADEAANNLANLLSKITSDETKTKFKNQGIDLEGSMQAAIAKGYDPVAAFLGVIEQSMKKTDPEKAKKLAEIQAQIAKTEDPAKRQKMLDGYLAMAGLSEYIADMQAKQAALAAIQNKELHQQNLQKIKSTDGVAKIEQDLAARREASAQRWTEAANAMNEGMAKIGDAIRPITDQVAVGITKLGEAVAYVSQEAPGLTAGLVAAGGAFAAWKVAKGGLGILGGALDVTRGLLGGGGKGGAAAGERSLLGKVVDRFTGGKGGAAVDEAFGAGAEVQQVFVTNWPGSGGGVLDTHTGQATPVTEQGNGRALGGALGLLERVGGKLGGALAVGTAAYQVYDTATHATTAEEKADGYGGAAGGLAGGLAGAKLGALAGTLAGPIGTVVGGLLGGALGSFGGDALGGWLGRTLVKPEEQPAAAPESRDGIGTTLDNLAEAVTGPLGTVLDSLPEAVTEQLGPVLGTLLGSDALGTWLGRVMPEKAAPAQGSAVAQPEPAAAEVGRAVESSRRSRRRRGRDRGLGSRNQEQSAMDAASAPESESSGPEIDYQGLVEKLLEATQPEEAPAPPPVTQTVTFAPTLTVTVQGDVKDPQQLAGELMPHLRRMFDEFQAKQARAQLFDAAHV
ncbi:phage tail tape measure protein [Azotobacter chroococcum]|uniref:phage tail tape measure protein n=1 Tax=Azotobacter chroococcum TaxID=353 RepID=UPI0010AE4E90|nr:phage tail tape measure protein [Azotobacter chroococcum]TKD40698.1 phage tail tape measure protein [Azotobacter chroococcum]